MPVCPCAPLYPPRFTSRIVSIGQGCLDVHCDSVRTTLSQGPAVCYLDDGTTAGVLYYVLSGEALAAVLLPLVSRIVSLADSNVTEPVGPSVATRISPCAVSFGAAYIETSLQWLG